MTDAHDTPTPPESPEAPEREGNRGFTPDEMRAAFGPHPMADWKPVIRRKRRRR